MVLLTITPSILEGLKLVQSSTTALAADSAEADETQETKTNETRDETTADPKAKGDTNDDKSIPLSPLPSESDLGTPIVGGPISHSQVIELWKSLKEKQQQGEASTQSKGSENSIRNDTTSSLEALLIGAKVYVPPPPPKKEPSPEYKALMARLRRDEEARAYERMVNPDPYTNMATARLTSSFAQVNRPVSAADIGDDEVTFNDVNRQVMLIFNFLVTMLGVAYALWVLARWWPTPARLFLAMGGSIAVGIAEYGLYAGYVWHLSEAAKKEKTAAPKEVREVVKTWVVEREEQTSATAEAAAEAEAAAVVESKEAVAIPDSTGATGVDGTQARRRKKEAA
ncbi:vacuolar h+-atpase assembly protein [Ophiostoma piceae UAMH 11346]|uniref:Vacuolar h+-atpase assembly protein n=1 Tax=Ophiostoma piceae (strain UAMH 11346) TaxID=1262450 RepID=S3CFL6_OPHP1|nr:vacuolar h+-atpase assembly protein [Ophiostoma piceae UAMH 11346]